jgi:hypothetical protein
MKSLQIVYWIRVGLGVTIGILCGLYLYFSVSGGLSDIYTFLTGLSFAMLFYIATYYIIKVKFLGKVDKPAKLIREGIGTYFLVWIVSWVLIVTLFIPSVSITIYNTTTGNSFSGQGFWVVARNSANQVVQNMTIFKLALPPGTYTIQLGIRGYNVTNQNQTITLGWLQSVNVSFDVTQSKPS